MNNKKYILSIDCGTQSIRALIFDTEGNLIDKEKIEYQMYFSNKPGYAEKDAQDYYESLRAATTNLKSRNTQLFNKIEGVGITTQRDTMVCLDKDGNPLRPAILWLDQRKSKVVYDPNIFMKAALACVGMGEAIQLTQVEGKCNWIAQNEPTIWNNTYKYTQISGYLNYKLTNKFKDSIASQIGHIPFNYKKLRWAKSNELNKKFFPIEDAKLVELVEPGTTIGYITKKACEETGIPQGTPVIATGSDKGCETIGMGVIDTNQVSLSFGTTATVQTTSKRYFEPLSFMPAYPAPIKDSYNPEVEIFRGYWMIKWYQQEFGYEEIQEAKEKGIPPEIILNKYLEEVPAGSSGLIVQPYWSPGLKMPSAKGTIIGFGDIHKKSHLYKAVIEGLAFALLEGMHKIEKTSHKKIERVAVSGGASQSEQICQITCDIFNKPLVRGQTFETSGLGSAIITAVGLNLFENYQQAIDKMVHYKKEFTPNAENTKIYKDLYERVYTKIYKKVNKLNKEIRNITGYPEKIV